MENKARPEWETKTINALRRIVCLPPLEEPEEVFVLAEAQAGNAARPLTPQALVSPVGESPDGSSGPQAGSVPEPKKSPEPHGVRLALYPLALGFTLAYLFLEIREFFSGKRGNFLSPQTYQGLLGVYAGELELRRWSEHSDRDALAAESIIYLWWIALLAAWVSMNVVEGNRWTMPADLETICREVLVIFFGVGASKFFHAKGEKAPAMSDASVRDKVLEYVRRQGRIGSGQCAELLGYTDRHARNILTKMVKDGLLEREGTPFAPASGYRLPK